MKKTVCEGRVNQLLRWLVVVAAGLSIGGNAMVFADQVQMRNGDQYFGTVLSLNKDTLVIQSDVLGTVRLPRTQVASVDFGVDAVTRGNAVAPLTNSLTRSANLTPTNASVSLSTTLQQLGGNSNVLQQIQTQYLSDAGPEAKAKFNELLSGYLSGKLTVNDIRAQAQTTVDQVRGIRKDLGEDAGGLIDGYLAILDTFLKETAPPPTSVTNTATSRPPKPAASLPEEE